MPNLEFHIFFFYLSRSVYFRWSLFIMMYETGEMYINYISELLWNIIYHCHIVISTLILKPKMKLESCYRAMIIFVDVSLEIALVLQFALDEYIKNKILSIDFYISHN